MATSLGIDRVTIRQLAAVMALVLAIANLPSIGVIVISDRSGPTISLDVCHPLQALDTSPNVLLIARPAQPETGAQILSRETVAQFVIPILRSKFVWTPDPPPPKQFC